MALAASRPDLELGFATSDRWVGERVDARLGITSDASFCSHDEGVRRAGDVDVVVLASSAEHAMKLAPALGAHARVVDLSGAFRLDAASYPGAYGFDHEAPAELERAFYGLPELFGPPPQGTRIVANPGCYATAALLATCPLLRDELVTGDVIVDGKSGVTGAGRRADVDYSFVELAENVRPYKVGRHPHGFEIARHAQRFSSRRARVTFTPHLIPLRRGLVVTAYMTASEGTTTASVRASLERAYAGKPLVRIVDVEAVSLHAVAGTPLAVVGASAIDGVVVSVCALDNLMKGAASQAMQNVNGLVGLADTTGLTAHARFAP